MKPTWVYLHLWEDQRRILLLSLIREFANKVSGWKEKILTLAGKEILIKSVAQAVPSYTMSCFLLPKNLCEELTSVIRQFWWGQIGNEKKTEWLS